MQIILLETLNKLGKAGEVVNVKDGYANNFLIPQKKAIVANKKNRDQLNSRMSQIKLNNEKKINEANTIKNLIENGNIEIQMEANEEGDLYGSINQKLILEGLKNKYEVELNPDNIISSQIKKIGIHQVEIRLYDEISTQINLEIKKN